MAILNKEIATAIIKAGTLAANAGNFQPWDFEVYPDRICLSLHPHRNVENDDNRRKAIISLGCALQNMIIKASSFKLKLDYVVEEKNDVEEVIINFSIEENVHHWHHILDEIYINRSTYDANYQLTNTQVQQLQQLSPFKHVNLLLLDEEKSELFSDLIYSYANPNEKFQNFQSASAFGAIAANKPFAFSQLIEVGRVFVLLQLWTHEQNLSFQPVGCYMVGIFDKHQVSRHRNAENIAAIFANQKNLQPVIGFRIGKATGFFKPRKRLPVEDVVTWHLD